MKQTTRSGKEIIDHPAKGYMPIMLVSSHHWVRHGMHNELKKNASHYQVKRCDLCGSLKFIERSTLRTFFKPSAEHDELQLKANECAYVRRYAAKFEFVDKLPGTRFIYVEDGSPKATLEELMLDEQPEKGRTIHELIENEQSIKIRNTH